MGSIYGYAAEVLSMLGSPSIETDYFLDEANARLAAPDRKISSNLPIGCLNLFGNDYWRRAWVFQEIAMARRLSICCGSKLTSVDTMFTLSRSIDKHYNDKGIRGNIRMLRLLRHSKPVWSRFWKHGMTEAEDPSEYVMKGANSTFLAILRKSRRHKACGDPRDILYSRLALALDANTIIPYPDYEITVEDLYTRFATNSIILGRSLEILIFSNSTKMKLPTWIPDWSSQDTDWDPDSKYGSLADSLKSLTWNDSTLPRISRCRTELMVQARVVKTLQKHDFDELATSAIISASRFAADYPLSEVPRMGDLVCVLRGCPLLVYLRTAGQQHYIVVGRHSSAQAKLYKPEMGLLTSTPDAVDEKKQKWSFCAPEDIQRQREEVFRLR
jgi:hypothetical protein